MLEVIADLAQKGELVQVSFKNIVVGEEYSRSELAEMWDYASFHPLARGVVTPREDNKIILFVTEEQPDFQQQYEDALEGNLLYWEGPTDHFAEDRMIRASDTEDQIHVFHRLEYPSDFTYLGQAEVIDVQRHSDRPSKFRLRIL